MKQKPFNPRHPLWKHGRTAAFFTLLLLGLYLISRSNYLLFHVLAEMLSVIVAWSIFVVAMSAWQFQQNHYISFIGIAFLFVGGFDLLHTLAYKGMGVFPGNEANRATQLWVIARYIESLSMLVAPFFLKHRLKPRLAFGIYGVLGAILIASVFYWQNFPVSYVDGLGLTPFKIASEYVIISILALAFVVHFRNQHAFDRAVFRPLLASLVAAMASELSFTLYVDVYGFFNLLGHGLKLISFSMIYMAFVYTGFVQPYRLLFRDLKLNEEALRSENAELDAFSHTVAHDLKNPISLMVGFASLLHERGRDLPEDEFRECTAAIVDSGHKMDGIIEDLLLLAGVRKQNIQPAPLGMSGIVAEAMRRLERAIRKAEAEIRLPVEWPTALGYGPWVEEIWVNYIGNALNYGGRKPQIELGADQAQAGIIRFWIRDHGPGISPTDQARLFTPFTQLAQVKTEGHGLGLSIVMRIAEKLGGTAGVESQIDRGSLFWFTLKAADRTATVTSTAPQTDRAAYAT